MGFKLVSLIFLLAGVVCLFLLKVYSFWPVYAAAFCFLVSVLTFMISIFGRKGSLLWRGRGQG